MQGTRKFPSGMTSQKGKSKQILFGNDKQEDNQESKDIPSKVGKDGGRFGADAWVCVSFGEGDPTVGPEE